MTTEAEVSLDGGDHGSPKTLDLLDIRPALTASDIDASLAWYRDVVGFEVQQTHEHDGKIGAVSLSAGSARLLLVQDDGAKGIDRAKGEGFRLHMATAGDVDEIAAGIEQRGGALESPPVDTPWGSRAFSLVDPDGFKITISSEA